MLGRSHAGGMRGSTYVPYATAAKERQKRPIAPSSTPHVLRGKSTALRGLDGRDRLLHGRDGLRQTSSGLCIRLVVHSLSPIGQRRRTRHTMPLLLHLMQMPLGGWDGIRGEALNGTAGGAAR